MSAAMPINVYCSTTEQSGKQAAPYFQPTTLQQAATNEIIKVVVKLLNDNELIKAIDYISDAQLNHNVLAMLVITLHAQPGQVNNKLLLDRLLMVIINTNKVLYNFNSIKAIVVAAMPGVIIDFLKDFKLQEAIDYITKAQLDQKTLIEILMAIYNQELRPNRNSSDMCTTARYTLLRGLSSFFIDTILLNNILHNNFAIHKLQFPLLDSILSTACSGSITAGLMDTSWPFETPPKQAIYKLIKTLVAHRVDIENITNLDDETLLIIAAIYSFNFLKFLLDTGDFDINAKNKIGFTPLMVSASIGDTHIDTTKYLLAHGADPLITNRYHTALQLATLVSEEHNSLYNSMSALDRWIKGNKSYQKTIKLLTEAQNKALKAKLKGSAINIPILPSGLHRHLGGTLFGGGMTKPTAPASSASASSSSSSAASSAGQSAEPAASTVELSSSSKGELS